jgi:flagellar biosynthesis protein FlhG
MDREVGKLEGLEVCARNARSERALAVCVASGKGGTGKSVVSASLAHGFAQRGRTLLFDADLGVGNAHLLHDVVPVRTLVEVVAGEACIRDAVIRCGHNLDLVPAGSGVSHMAGLSTSQLYSIAVGLEELDWEYDFVVVDSAAGLSQQTLLFAASCDLALIVTTSDITAMTDAYAFLKVMPRGDALPLLLVNRVESEEQGRRVALRIADVSAKFLGFAPCLLPCIPDDPTVGRSIAARRSVLAHDPEAPAARSLWRCGEELLELANGRSTRGLGRSLVESLLAREIPVARAT